MTDDEAELLGREAATKALIHKAAGTESSGLIQWEHAEGGPDFNERFIRPGILPVGLGIAGGIAGALLGPMGSAVGGAIGAGLGEAANQALGITDPSLAEVGKTAGYSAAGSAAGALVSKVAPFVMPSRVAQALNAMGPQAAAAKIGSLQPHINSGKLFEMAAKSQVKVPMNRTLHALDDMLDDLSNVSSGVQGLNSMAINHLKGLKTTIESSVPGMDPMRLQKELAGVGAMLEKLKADKVGGKGALKTVFGAMVKDLDDAAKMGLSKNPTHIGVQALVDARQAYKRENVLDEIGNAIKVATRSQPGQGEAIRFDASKVINKIRHDDRLSKFYQEAFQESERVDLEKLLYTLNKIPALRPGAGQTFGFGRVGGSATAAGGAGFAASSGDPFLTGLAVVGGSALPAGIEIGKDVALALQLKTGRALVGELLKQSQGSLTPNVASVIGAYAAAVRQGQVNE